MTKSAEERLLQRIPHSDNSDEWIKVIRGLLDARAPAGNLSKVSTRLTYLRVAVSFVEFLVSRYGKLFTFKTLSHKDMIEIVPDFLALEVSSAQSKDRARREKMSSYSIPPSSKYRQLRLTVLSALYDYAGFLRLMMGNPAREYRLVMGRNAVTKRECTENVRAKALNVKELDAFFQAIQKISLTGNQNGNRSEAVRNAIIARNELIFATFEATGMRIDGLVGMDLHDLDLDVQEIRVTEKGNKTRIVALAPHSMGIDEMITRYGEWLEVHRPVLEKDSPSSAMWLSERGTRLSRRTIQTISTKAMQQARIRKMNFGPHMLRHTATTLLLDDGVAPRDLQIQLGHAHISTVSIYDSNDDQKARERIRKHAHKSGRGQKGDIQSF